MKDKKKHNLSDIQSSKDTRGIDLQKVGVKNVEIPLNVIQKDGGQQMVMAKATSSVDLPKHYKGTHMSRFVEVLNIWRSKKMLSLDIEGCLKQIIQKLKASNAYLKLEFKYFIDKKAPLSELSAPMGYNCAFEGLLVDKEYNFFLTVEVPITTLCPCSKEISDYGAHNQRALVTVKLSYDPDKIVWIEDLVELVEQSGSSPIFPLLKRQDEKFVTEQAYNNPKFVEDVIRDLVVELRKINFLYWYEIECEAFESIHNHSAWAFQREELKT